MINSFLYNLKNTYSKIRFLNNIAFNNYVYLLSRNYVLEFEIKNEEIILKEDDNLKYINNKYYLFFDNYNTISDYLKILNDEAINNKLNDYFNFDYEIKNKTDFNIMGILNITPDSFSDGGKYINEDDAYNQFLNLSNNGADIIDIGGESSRPGASDVDSDIELQRTIPIIKKIIKNYPQTIISIDTKKAIVAKEALINGATIVNDISGFEYDSEMINVLKQFKPKYVLMHMKGTPQNMQNAPYYLDPVKEIINYFEEKINILKKNGINDIVIDPGIGFGKRTVDNFEIINRLDEFKVLGYPILIGLSKKRFLGETTGAEIANREVETIIMETIAVNNGASYIRTHNVENCNKLKLLFNNYKNLLKNV